MELLSCHSAHPLACACLNSRADRQAKFRETSYADERRSVVVNRQGPRAQEPASWSHVLWPPCPQPRRIDIIAQGLSQPHWTTIQTPPTPSQPSQRQPTTPASSHPPVRISERLSTTDSLRPPPIRPPYYVRRTSLLQGFARSTSH